METQTKSFEPSSDALLMAFAMVPEPFIRRGLEIAVKHKISSIDINRSMKKWRKIGWLNKLDAKHIADLMEARKDERMPMQLLDAKRRDICLKRP